MGTPFREVNNAFLGRIEQDEWSLTADLGNLERDWFELMKMAIARFMFPRVSLEYNEVDECFVEELGQEEIQVLAVLMKNEWLKRCLATWRVIQQQYHTKDFEFLSQANHMSKLIDLVELSNREVSNMINVYGRMRNHQPFNWSQLAGGKTNG
ncbi:MAG: hypothetical protein SPE58_00410 [Lactobacillus johnsonii]|nr:hypothetical protein [Lactobacillus johnsonii]